MSAFRDVLVRRLNTCDRIEVQSGVLPMDELKKIHRRSIVKLTGLNLLYCKGIVLKLPALLRIV